MAKPKSTSDRALAGAGKVFPQPTPSQSQPATPQQQPNSPLGGVPAPLSTSSAAPIGVPPGYTAYPNISRPGGPGTALYFTGAELKPQTEGWPAERIIAFQKQLEAMGLLDPGYQLGIWDKDSITAYSKVLSYANQRGISADAAMASVSDIVSRYGNTTDAKKRQPLTVTLTNPSDIASLATQIAVRTIGRRLTDTESSQLAQAYNVLERQYQEQAYAAAGSGLSDNATGGTITQPPNASTYAESTLRAEHPEDVSEMNTINNVDAFRQLLASSASRVRSVG
jgi:hypothetical protein